jgi:hypothetical protein
VNRESLRRESAATQRGQISTFEDLEVYAVAREFRKAMYRVAKNLPETEEFGLASPKSTRRNFLNRDPDDSRFSM